MQSVENFPFITFSYLYSSVDNLLRLILGVVVYKSYRPFLIFSYEKFWFKFSQKIQRIWVFLKKPLVFFSSGGGGCVGDGSVYDWK